MRKRPRRASTKCSRAKTCPRRKSLPRSAPLPRSRNRAGVDGVWGIVVAAGRGDRFGQPKQFCDFAGMRVIDLSLAALNAVCDAVVVVLPVGVSWDGESVAAAVAGGETRSDSVRAGLRAIPEDVAVVVVHDAARPLATRALFEAVIIAVQSGAD